MFSITLQFFFVGEDHDFIQNSTACICWNSIVHKSWNHLDFVIVTMASLCLYDCMKSLSGQTIRVNTTIASQTAFLSTLSKTRATKHNTGLCNKMLFEFNSCVTINIIIIILYSFKNFKYYFINIRKILNGK